MTTPHKILLVALLSTALTSSLFAADNPQADQGNNTPPRDANDGGMPPPPDANMGRPPFGGMMGGLGLMNPFARDNVTQLLAILSELNMTPEFTLTVEQKTKITTLREAFQKIQDQWQKDHLSEFKEINDKLRELRDNNGSQEDFQALNQERRKLLDSSPKGADTAQQIKSLLTPDQLNAVNAKIKAQEALQKEMSQRFNRGPGEHNNGPANNNDQTPPQGN